MQPCDDDNILGANQTTRCLAYCTRACDAGYAAWRHKLKAYSWKHFIDHE